MGTKNKQLPEFLQGVYPEPGDREEYRDAMSNLVRLVEYLRINDDLLTAYDYRVMLMVELERDHVRQDILKRLYGKFSTSRRRLEEKALMT